MSYEPPIVALSIAHSDFMRMPESLMLADGDFDWVHFDIADGDFVPRMTFGPPVLRLARRFSAAVFDAHLLVARPAPLVAPLVEAGATVVTVHACACEMPKAVLGAIRAAGARAGIAIGPEHNFDSVRRLLTDADVVLIATASLQYDGAEFLPELLGRVQMAREHREREGLSYLIEVDGGIALPNVAAVREAGADVFVVGQPVLAAGDPAVALAMFRAAVRNESLHHSVDGVTREAAPAPKIRYLKRRAA